MSDKNCLITTKHSSRIKKQKKKKKFSKQKGDLNVLSQNLSSIIAKLMALNDTHTHTHTSNKVLTVKFIDANNIALNTSVHSIKR